MNCDNTDCEGKSKVYYDCILTKEFDSEECRWCEACLDRDNDMIESYQAASGLVKLQKLTDKQDGLMLLDFRQQHWDEWVKYCNDEGYEAEVEEYNE